MFSKDLQTRIAPHTATLRAAAIAVAAVVVVVQWISTMIKPRGDFMVHREFGRRMLNGEMLHSGPYPPFWGVFFAPMALVPANVAMPLFFVLGFCACVVFLKIVSTLARPLLARTGVDNFWLIAAALVILSRFVLRDFADGGANLFINALTWSGIWFIIKRKPLPGGALLGFAIALKCTPLLFLGYFFLKRQWMAVVSTLAFATLFFVSPVLIQGRTSYIAHMTEWKNNVLAGVAQKDPSNGVLGPDELANKSLRPMLARYLMQLPAGHPGRFPGKAHIDFFRFSPETANRIVKLITYGSFLIIIWLFFRSTSNLNAPPIPWECAIMNILMLLYSPITWGQHCVALIPAVCFICVRYSTGKPIPRWITGTMAGVVFIFIVVNRSLIGTTLSDLAESYHVITICMIALTAVSLAFWNEVKNSPAES